MDPAIETASVMDVELWNRHDVVSAIEGRLEALAGSGVIRCDEVSMWSVEERVKVDHVARHVIGPFEDLGSDVDQECIRGPAAEDHNFCRGVVHEEERHCGSRPKGLVPNFHRVEPEGFGSPEYRAGVSEQFSDKIVADFDRFSIKNCGAERSLFVPTRNGCDDSFYCRSPA